MRPPSSATALNTLDAPRKMNRRIFVQETLPTSDYREFVVHVIYPGVDSSERIFRLAVQEALLNAWEDEAKLVPEEVVTRLVRAMLKGTQKKSPVDGNVYWFDRYNADIALEKALRQVQTRRGRNRFLQPIVKEVVGSKLFTLMVLIDAACYERFDGPVFSDLDIIFKRAEAMPTFEDGPRNLTELRRLLSVVEAIVSQLFSTPAHGSANRKPNVAPWLAERVDAQTIQRLEDGKKLISGLSPERGKPQRLWRRVLAEFAELLTHLQESLFNLPPDPDVVVQRQEFQEYAAYGAKDLQRLRDTAAMRRMKAA